MPDYVALGEPCLVLGYDWERSEDIEIELASFRIVSNVHLEHDVPLTIFVLGELLDSPEICGLVREYLEIEQFRRLVDIAQHSYSHTEFKRLRPDVRPLGLAEVRTEVRKVNELILREFQVDCHGIRAPQGHYRGFQGDDDILSVLCQEGLHYVSSDLRNEQGTFPSEWTDAGGRYRQPYFYDRDKYPGLLEIPTQGWNDNGLKGMSRTSDVKAHSLAEEIEIYEGYADFALERGLAYAPLFHPWAIAMTDRQGYVLKSLILYAREHEMRILNYRQLYDWVIESA